MLNQVVVVGRIKGIENGAVVLAVPRSFKNAEGEYETDYIEAKLLKNMMDNVLSYCENGDLVGIKGRLESDLNRMYVIAEKVTFLSSKGKNND